MTNHRPSHHGRTGSTIDARPNDGAFVAAVAVPVVAIAAIWVIGTPTAAVSVAGFVVGATTAQSEVVGAVSTVVAGIATETDEPPGPDGTGR